jgi:CAAX protease family protein
VPELVHAISSLLAAKRAGYAKDLPRARGQEIRMSRTRFLRLEWLLSLALIVLSLAWAVARELPLVAGLIPSIGGLALGVLAGAALWSTIPLLLRSASMRRVWHDVLLPFSRALDTRDIVVIAVLSGFTEELFFRGVLLPEIGLGISSLCFGALHALCAVYFLWATAIGAGLGALALASGSLVPAIVAHATYNLGALLLLRHSALQTAVATPQRVPAAIASPHGIG